MIIQSDEALFLFKRGSGVLREWCSAVDGVMAVASFLWLGIVDDGEHVAAATTATLDCGREDVASLFFWAEG